MKDLHEKIKTLEAQIVAVKSEMIDRWINALNERGISIGDDIVYNGKVYRLSSVQVQDNDNNPNASYKVFKTRFVPRFVLHAILKDGSGYSKTHRVCHSETKIIKI